MSLFSVKVALSSSVTNDLDVVRNSIHFYTKRVIPGVRKLKRAKTRRFIIILSNKVYGK